MHGGEAGVERNLAGVKQLPITRGVWEGSIGSAFQIDLGCEFSLAENVPAWCIWEEKGDGEQPAAVGIFSGSFPAPAPWSNPAVTPLIAASPKRDVTLTSERCIVCAYMAAS